MRLAECPHLGCARENGDISLSLCARGEAIVGRNIEKDSVESLSLIESELNPSLLRRRPILIGLPLVQPVEVVDDVHLHVFEEVYDIIVFEGLSEKR